MKFKYIEIENFQEKEVELPDEIFNVPVRKDILHLVVRWQLAKKRQGTHCTKTRSEVRGGGRKPRPQKHTGRSRQGSIRSPQWKGGYTVHGPRPRSYEFKVNKKVRKMAIRCALSYKVKNGLLKLLDKYPDFKNGKTKEGINFLKNLGVNGNTSLIVFNEKDEKKNLALRNIEGVKVIQKEGLNTYDILAFKNLIMTLPTVDYIVERYGK